jgi:hypothetical protein
MSVSDADLCDCLDEPSEVLTSAPPRCSKCRRSIYRFNWTSGHVEYSGLMLGWQSNFAHAAAISEAEKKGMA